jgi:hypothetical protein
MSERFQWNKDPTLLIVGFPVGGEDVDKMASEYLEIARRTHAPHTFEPIEDLTDEEREEMFWCATMGNVRAGAIRGETLRHNGVPVSIRATFRRCIDSEEYEIVREYRAFRMGAWDQARRVA